jgi:predicted O-linked N-acetylglucosamine transferase (SPINDLY family)
MDQYRRIDIALDPFPYAGGMTTCHALWMGVPVITLAGKTAIGRGGVSILSNLGLEDLIADSEQAYIRIAAAQANDGSRLAYVRTTIREQMKHSPLMDARQFAADLENAYRQMWRARCATGPLRG